MNRKQGALSRAAGRILDLDGPAYGDERERAVFNEAATFGFTVGIYVNLAAAFVAALFGGLLLPAVLLLLAAVPSWSAMWWAGRQGVDVTELAERGGRRRKAVVGAVVVGSMFLTFAAMACTVFVGHGLISTPEVVVTGSEAGGPLASLVQGAVVGGMIGLLIFAVAIAVKTIRGPRVRPEPADDDE